MEIFRILSETFDRTYRIWNDETNMQTHLQNNTYATLHGRFK